VSLGEPKVVVEPPAGVLSVVPVPVIVLIVNCGC
jgi:hypothetical protein